MKKIKDNKKYIKVAGRRIKLPKYDEDFVYVEYDINDLHQVNVESFPRQVVMVVNSEDGVGTGLFHEIEVYGGEQGVFVEFHCNVYNKFWEGFWGLSTFLTAIYNQLKHNNDYEIIDFDIDDVFKVLNVDRQIIGNGSVYDAVIDAAADLKEVMEKAESSLCDECQENSLKEQRNSSAISS